MGVIIVLIVLALILFLFFKRRSKAYLNDNVNTLLITGGVGLGKTFNAVRIAKKRLIRARKLVAKKNRKIKFRNLFIFNEVKKKSLLPLPLLYSNFPIDFGFIKSIDITKEHLMLKKRIVENSIVVLDEFGTIASQYSFQDDEVRINISEFTRYFRQYYGNYGLLIAIDQSPERVSKEVRMSVGSVYDIIDKKTLFGRFYTFKFVKYDSYSQYGIATNVDNIFKIRGFFPFKKWYNDRAFSIRSEVLPFDDDFINKNEYQLDLLRLDDDRSNLDILLEQKAKKLAKKQLEKNKKKEE